MLQYPELVALLGRLYQMMDSRVAIFGRLSRLQGKLDLMLSQITLQGQDEEDTDAAQMPMLVYHDDESDEERAVEDAITDLSGSEDDWEEMSDIDLNGKNTDSEAEDAISVESMSEDD
ncbi:hypothetical protein LSAT2_032743 [Lamellibrachia satsuma]|nr:hypothetical protein LSAT2_032743 [Lamellibrachia satsuma]